MAPRKKAKKEETKDRIMVAYRGTGQELWNIKELTDGTPSDLFMEFSGAYGWKNVMLMKLIPTDIHGRIDGKVTQFKETMPRPKPREKPTLPKKAPLKQTEISMRNTKKRPKKEVKK